MKRYYMQVNAMLGSVYAESIEDDEGGWVLYADAKAALDAKDRERGGAVGAALAISGDAISRGAAEAAATITALRKERDGLREALEYYASEGTYGMVCAMHDGVPSEMPHLAIEEDGGKIARAALAAGQAGAKNP